MAVIACSFILHSIYWEKDLLTEPDFFIGTIINKLWSRDEEHKV